ncbi:hypothetical protein ACQ643_005214, partial [Escherichia coli]
MSKKFSKTILSSAIAGLMMVSSGAVAATPENKVIGDYTIQYSNNGETAKIIDKQGKDFLPAINTSLGSVTTVNTSEAASSLEAFLKANAALTQEQKAQAAQIIGEMHRYSINVPSLKLDNIDTLTVTDIESIKANVDAVSKVITSKTAADYNQAVSNGMSSEAALAAASSANGGGAMLHEFSRIGTNITNNTKAIQSNSRQLQEHNARLNDHQRQIRENHEEMKRAAAQSAALA